MAHQQPGHPDRETGTIKSCFTRSFGFVEKSSQYWRVWAPVYSPYRVDTQKEAMLPAAIEEMAYRFLMNGGFDKIDTQHNLAKSGNLAFESFVAKGSDTPFSPGDWVLGVQIVNEEHRQAVASGKLNGYSWYAPPGALNRVAYDVELDAPIVMHGETELNIGGAFPPHTHAIKSIYFTGDARVIPGMTERALGHTHQVIEETATEPFVDHAHYLKFQVPASALAQKAADVVVGGVDTDGDSGGSSGIIIETHRIKDTVTLLENVMLTWISLVDQGANWTPFTIVQQQPQAA